MEILTPPNLQAQAPGSLLAAANTPAQTLARAGFGGHGYQGLACTGWTTVDQCTGQTADVQAGVRGALVTAVPFGIQVVDECSTIGKPDLEGRVRTLMSQVESAAIAREFWTGELAAKAVASSSGTVKADWQATAHLASSSTTTLTSGAPVSLRRGIGMLEDALGDNQAGAPGCLHMRRSTLVASGAALAGSLRVEGSQILTLTGQRLVADAGYPGTGPNGAAPAAGQAWIYATSRPTISRSDVQIIGQPGERINRATNQVRTTAEEWAVHTIVCGVYAVQVSLE